MYRPHGLLWTDRNGGNLLIPYAPLGDQRTDDECILIARKLTKAKKAQVKD